MAAAMNKADAKISFAPCTLLKWELERIQTSKGILQMRLSVMELGRFTLGDSGGTGKQLDYAPRGRGRQCGKARGKTLEVKGFRAGSKGANRASASPNSKAFVTPISVTEPSCRPLHRSL